MKKYALGILLVVGFVFAIIFSSSGSRPIQNPADKTGVFECQELDLGLEDAKMYQIGSIQVTEDSIYLLVNAYYSDRSCLFHYGLDLQGNVITSQLVHDGSAKLDRYITYQKLLEEQKKDQEENQKEDFLTDQIEQQLKDKNVSYYSRRKDANSGFDYVMEGVLGIYGYQEETGEVTEIMNYLNSDKAFEGYWGFSNIRFIDRDHFVAVQRNNVTSEKRTQIFYCSRVSPDKVPDREKVVLATDSLAKNVWNKIVAFNQSNDTYRISVEIYDWSFDDDRNSTACLEEMEQRGIKPDLFYMSGVVPTVEYEEQGYFADIYEFMHQDKSFRENAYCMNVFQACERNGKLCRVPVGFFLDTAIGKVASVMELRKKSHGYSWEEMVPVGFPDEEGKGSSILGGAGFAISAAAVQKDGAWEAVKYFLSKEVQTEVVDIREAYGLPVHKKALKNQLLSMTEEIIPPVDSEPRRDPDLWVWTGSENVLLPAFSRETALRWYEYICSY